jgi:hypothetical protein
MGKIARTGRCDFLASSNYQICGHWTCAIQATPERLARAVFTSQAPALQAGVGGSIPPASIAPARAACRAAYRAPLDFTARAAMMTS